MKANQHILITGTTGFVGSALLPALSQHHQTRPITRTEFGDLLPTTDYTAALTHADVVIHLAARVHVMQDTATDPLAAFRNTNTAGTLNLARQAAAAGVRSFIFLSSIKVNGEHTTASNPFTTDDTHIPTDSYGISKYEAEQGLRELAVQTGMEVVIIRPPLVYGPGVKANFLSMMRWLHKGIPLPLGAIHNQRSLVALDNLVDLITTCIDHPAAANQTFLVSDGEDLSTTELLQRLSHALGKPARLLPIPQSWLETALTLVGKRAIAQRLCGNLQVDISKTRDLLGWTPPLSVDEALRQTAQAYLQNQR
ncbi:SDR family oxidoreductase [Thiothrix lacustris]|uniref:SDR family oxidoreductase n=1 Tax=Thiothrix lacustris TaxID=525917 RepID=A0ABY9MP06_9GAMM|nr:SDR family oxidoreductase [Thiothrix lacustris]WML90399.1 SDR family oxidoreductase [Thiothrix lacustris]